MTFLFWLFSQYFFYIVFHCLSYNACFHFISFLLFTDRSVVKKIVIFHEKLIVFRFYSIEGKSDDWIVKNNELIERIWRWIAFVISCRMNAFLINYILKMNWLNNNNNNQTNNNRWEAVHENRCYIILNIEDISLSSELTQTKSITSFKQRYSIEKLLLILLIVIVRNQSTLK
jgi:hypothetical protein